MGLTPYHGGGVPAERVKLISNLALEMSLTPHYEGGDERRSNQLEHAYIDQAASQWDHDKFAPFQVFLRWNGWFGAPWAVSRDCRCRFHI
jgi:hypothetical protein